jgi:hypothetical protein
LAIWTARCPTPPAAPATSTRCPDATLATSARVCHAVRPAIGRAAASTKRIFGGIRAKCLAGALTYSA